MDGFVLIELVGVAYCWIGTIINMMVGTKGTHVPGILIIFWGFAMIFHRHLPFLSQLFS